MVGPFVEEDTQDIVEIIRSSHIGVSADATGREGCAILCQSNIQPDEVMGEHNQGLSVCLSGLLRRLSLIDNSTFAPLDRG